MGTPTGRLRADVESVAKLSPATVEEMWGVFSKYYADVSQEKFLTDLREKTKVIVLRDSGDRSVQGFSTIVVYERTLGGRRFVAVFSGDTVIDEAYWGQKALHRCFARYVTLTKAAHPFTDVYWFLITKGYKTYLLLSRNFPAYWPRYDEKTPSHIQEILDYVATERYGDDYRPDLGLLKFDNCQGRLKSSVAPIDADLLSEPDIGFFVEKNPGHGHGDELCCLGRVDFVFWAYFTARLITRNLKRALRLEPRKKRFPAQAE